MKASEALKQLRAKGSVDEMLGLLMGKPLKRAIESLEREAEREEQELKKVTLEEMAVACDQNRCASCDDLLDPCADCKRVRLAAATLRKLDDEGGKALADHDERYQCAAVSLLRSLGAKEKP